MFFYKDGYQCKKIRNTHILEVNCHFPDGSVQSTCCDCRLNNKVCNRLDRHIHNPIMKTCTDCKLPEHTIRSLLR